MCHDCYPCPCSNLYIVYILYSTFLLLVLSLFIYCAFLHFLLLLLNFKISNIISENQALVKIDCASLLRASVDSNNVDPLFYTIDYVICAEIYSFIHSFIIIKIWNLWFFHCSWNDGTEIWGANQFLLLWTGCASDTIQGSIHSYSWIWIIFENKKSQ